MSAAEHGVPRDTHPRPLLRLRKNLGEACSVETLGAIEPAALAEFLQAQRWFGSKGETPRGVRLHDVVPLFAGAVLARIAVDLGGRAALYQLPLVARALEDARDVPERAVLARLVIGRIEGVLFDAVEDARFRCALLEAVVSGATSGAGGVRWIAAPVERRAGCRSPDDRATTEGKVVRAEQSNTSIIYGERAILKLYRRLEPGENPDVEIAEFLTTRTSFANVPALMGTIRLVESGGGTTDAAAADAGGAADPGGAAEPGGAAGGRGVTYAGMMQEYVASSGDGWEYALASLERYVAAADSAPPSFARDAARLGTITRGLHEALASDPRDRAFAPLPISSLDLRDWLEATGRSITNGLDLLETQWKQGAIPEALTPRVRELLGRRGEAMSYAGEIVATTGGRAGQRIRHHGDFHLGQTLRTADGDFVVIDFEGEPARPLEERRRPHSALRDVAGMLRSFDYAAAAVGARLLAPKVAGDGDGTADSSTASEPSGQRRHRADPAQPSGDADPVQQRRHRAAAWQRAARDAFLASYVGEAALPSFLPAEREDVLRLITFFEIEKAFYELAYELNNRPDWVAIPLAGILRLLEEEP